MGFFKKKEADTENRTPLGRGVIEAEVKKLILQEAKFLSEDSITPETALFSSGILESLAFLSLVVKLEKTFSVVLSKANTVNMQNFDRLQDIVTAVEKSLGGPSKKSA